MRIVQIADYAQINALMVPLHLKIKYTIDMKNTILLIIAIALLPLVSCEAGTEKEKDLTKEEVSKTNSSIVESSNISGQVIHLSKADFFEKVMNFEENPTEWVYEGDKPCIIDFYADWCRPCKIAGPVLEEIAEEYAGQITVYKIDTQKERELAGAFGIQSIPAFLWVPMNGKPQMSNGIARTPEETKKMFKQMIDDLLL